MRAEHRDWVVSHELWVFVGAILVIARCDAEMTNSNYVTNLES